MGQKEEKLRSMALSGPMIYDVKMERLVNNEQLAKPTVIFIRIPKMDNDPDWEWMDFSEQYDQGIINNEFRNMILAHAIIQMRVRGYSSLALIEKLDQGRNIAALLEGHSLNIQYISGKDKAETRDEAKTNLQSRELDVLVTSRIFNEGVDLPDLECVVVASGYKAAGLTLQRYGRAVRKTKQKSTTTIIDCYDEFAPKLLAHSEARLKMVQKNKAFDVMVIEWQDLEKALDELMEKRRKA
jgi:superfamily II DNA or RNA helicase